MQKTLLRMCGSDEREKVRLAPIDEHAFDGDRRRHYSRPEAVVLPR